MTTVEKATIKAPSGLAAHADATTAVFIFFPWVGGRVGEGKGGMAFLGRNPRPVLSDRLFDIFAKTPLVESQASCAGIGIAASHWHMDCSED